MITANRAQVRELSYEEERGKPAPSLLHAFAQTRLAAEFAKHLEYDVLPELDLQLGGRLLIPDLCVFPARPLDLQNDVLVCFEPPLLAVEILTFGQSLHSLIERIDHYLTHGVKSCWLVTPPLRVVTVFTPDGSRQSYSSGIVTDAAIGISADLAAVFGAE